MRPPARACARCGDGFRPAENHPRTRYCSRICAGHAGKRLPWFVCLQCEARYPKRRSAQVLCSRECSAYWKHNPKRLEATA